MTRAARILSAGALRRLPTPSTRLLGDVPRVPTIGEVDGLTMSYGNLRIGRLGDVEPMPVRRVSTNVARFDDLTALGLDLVLVPGPSRGGPRHLDTAVRSSLVACERAGVPTVLLADRPDDLATEVAPLVASVAASTPDVADVARPVAGREQVAETGSVVAVARAVARDVHPFRAGNVAVVVPGNGESDALVSAVGAAGGVARVVRPGVGRLRARLTAARAVAVVTHDIDALPTEHRHLVSSLATRGLPTITQGANMIENLRRLIVDESARSIASIAARRAAMLDNSLDAWLDRVLPTLRIPVLPPPTVSVVADLSSPATVERLAANVRRQRYPRIEVVAAATDQVTVERCQHVFGDVTVVAGSTRGERLTSAVHRSSGRWIALFDERAVYGPWHLMDLVLDAHTSGAEVVGRARCAMYDPERDVTGWWSSRSGSQLASGTLLVRRDAATRHGFPRLLGDPQRRLVESVVRAGGRVRTIHDHDVLLTGPVRGDQVTAGFDATRALVFGDGGFPVVEPGGRCADA